MFDLSYSMIKVMLYSLISCFQWRYVNATGVLPSTTKRLSGRLKLDTNSCFNIEVEIKKVGTGMWRRKGRVLHEDRGYSIELITTKLRRDNAFCKMLVATIRSTPQTLEFGYASIPHLGIILRVTDMNWFSLLQKERCPSTDLIVFCADCFTSLSSSVHSEMVHAVALSIP